MHCFIQYLSLKKVQTIILFATAILGLYTYFYPSFDSEHCSWQESEANSKFRALLFGDPQIRGASAFTNDLQSQLDIFGNDYFLGHIYKTLSRRLQPKNVIVLGDLFSSQWIDDDEFEVRANRYKNRIFRNQKGIAFYNLTGNHDIGYAHEITYIRGGRFEEFFGPLNFVVYDPKHDLRLIVFNSMAIDGLEDDEEAGEFTRDTKTFLQHQMQVDFKGTTIVATHVPLHKEAGICIDEPHFTFYGDNLIREQNMLSAETSQWILNGLFKSGSGIIVNGHDHEGCLLRHVYSTEQNWTVEPIQKGKGLYKYNENRDGVVEITIRSMMGEYGGNAGLLSVSNAGSVAYSLCTFGPQHIWWATQVMLIISLISTCVVTSLTTRSTGSEKRLETCLDSSEKLE
ncbi:Metallo-dependent phosphatase-like protein [Lipomyces arxii]|uniref:Metallo-dependent phosphatase-like protein n=1 Tax=Lipomyces arxii TaxID=56418 RepID=UPI0034CF5CFC